MNTLLREIYSHQAWADAKHWCAILSSPAASQDKVILERLHHIHLVQHAYLWIFRAERADFKFTRPADFPTTVDLKNYGRRFHHEIFPLLDSLANDDLKNKVTIPWSPSPSVEVTMEQALMQVVMHSHYHRAQNAVRFREMGGEPPGIDYVQWLWAKRPQPDWDGDKS